MHRKLRHEILCRKQEIVKVHAKAFWDSSEEPDYEMHGYKDSILSHSLHTKNRKGVP